MNKQRIILKTSNLLCLFILSLIFISCKETKSGEVTYIFSIQVGDEFMKEQMTKAESMVEDDESLEEVMQLVKKMNTERVYSLFFQNSQTVFAMDTKWLGQNDPNKVYVDYEKKQIIFPRSSNLIKEAFPQIDWQITTETKKIKDWEVKKAVTEFDGQNITAWFSLHPSLRIAPKNYVGLDGIVVELEIEGGGTYALTDFKENPSVEVKIP